HPRAGAAPVRALEAQGDCSGDRGRVSDAATENSVAVVHKGRRERSAATAGVPGTDTSKDAVDRERLIRAVVADVGDLNGAAAELAGDQRREAVERGRQQEAPTGDHRRRSTRRTERCVLDVGVPVAGKRAGCGARELAVHRGGVVLVAADRVVVGLRGETAGGRADGDRGERNEDQRPAKSHSHPLSDVWWPVYSRGAGNCWVRLHEVRRFVIVVLVVLAAAPAAGTAA